MRCLYYHIALLLLLVPALPAAAQHRDSLDEVTITEKVHPEKVGFQQLNAIEGMAIYEGKKTEVLKVDQLTVNKATNNARQAFGRIQGLNIWESDCGGLQLGIGGRGLNPKRSANFNMRQNGHDISADNLGYPESYYTPPLYSIDQIAVVRGAASLQYGTQFGGLVNFDLKEGPEDTSFAIESYQTLGSFGFFNSFNSIGGKKNKLNYYTYFQKRQGNCWRCNSEFDAYNFYSALDYQASDKLKIGLQYTYAGYLAQQPGGLTDEMFEEDPRQSIRNRNWFRIQWNILNLYGEYTFSPRTKIRLTNFSFLGAKDALGYLDRIDRSDPAENPELATSEQLQRDLLADEFRNNGTEARLLHRYELFGEYHAFSVGARYFRGHTWRRQGDASAGSGPEFSYLNPSDLEGSDYEFPTRNLAIFGEHIFSLTKRLSLTPGFRFESITTEAEGYYGQQIRDGAGNILLDTNIQEYKHNSRQFALYGLGLSYKWRDKEIYANFSSNYRGINFNNMRVVNRSIRVDSNLQDETGYTADLGWRGAIKDLMGFDLTAFVLAYNDRIGLKQEVQQGRAYALRTNIADALHQGVEGFAEVHLDRALGWKKQDWAWSCYTSFTLLRARYMSSEEPAFDGNRVEYVPEQIVRTGMNASYKQLEANVQHSFTGGQYSEATNAEFYREAIFGYIPSYQVLDFTASYSYKNWSLSASVNNLLNAHYFTRRATGYPGPGIIPADGRSFYLTLGFSNF